MIGQICILDGTDDAALESLARSIRAWEPRLDLYRPPCDARLFEPDGTLYAIATGDGMTMATERQALSIGRGDALIVPQGVALDLEPAVDLLAIRHDGPSPDHFRERFIQVWGFEHAPAPSPPDRHEGAARLTEVINFQDVRYRLPYAVRDFPPGAYEAERTVLETVLLIGLAGVPRLVLPGDGSRATLGPGMIAALGPGLSFQVEGGGRLGRLILLTELAHQARRCDRDRAAQPPLSPEFHPDSARPRPS